MVTPARPIAVVTLVAVAFVAVACAGSHQAQDKAAEGAAYGAIGGAVGGLVSALIWNDSDAIGRAAAGAATGAAVGATTGGLRGAVEDDKIRNRIGADAYDGAVHLVHCRYDQARTSLARAYDAPRAEHRLAAVYLDAIIVLDAEDEMERLPALYETIAKQDEDVADVAAAEFEVRTTLRKVRDLRVEAGRPRRCPES